MVRRLLARRGSGSPPPVATGVHVVRAGASFLGLGPASSLLLPPWTPCCCLTGIFLLSKGSSVGSGDAVFLVKFLSHVGCALFLLLLVASFHPCSRVSNPICRRFGAFRARRGGRGLLRQWERMVMLFQGLGCLVPTYPILDSGRFPEPHSFFHGDPCVDEGLCVLQLVLILCYLTSCSE